MCVLKQEKLIKPLRKRYIFPTWKPWIWLKLISKMDGINSWHTQGPCRDMEEKSRIPSLFLGYKYIYTLSWICSSTSRVNVVCASGQDTTWKYSWGGSPGKSSREESPRRTSLQLVRSGWLSSSSGACGWAGWISWEENVLGFPA